MTTLCPFLPGQPLNVLQVPVLLTGNENGQPRRSITCDNSEQFIPHMTMKPSDRFIAPRPPTRPKPKLRVKTSSPSVIRQLNNAASLPNAGNISSSGEILDVNDTRSSGAGTVDGPNDNTVIREDNPTISMGEPSPSISPPISKSFQDAFRRLSGRSRDAFLANPGVGGRQNTTQLQDKTISRKKAFPTLGIFGGITRGKNRRSRGASGQQLDRPTSSPLSPRHTGLPELPNSQSSVMAEDQPHTSHHHDRMLDADEGVHATTDKQIDSSLPYETSRSSEWGMNTDTDDPLSPESMITSPTFNNEPSSTVATEPEPLTPRLLSRPSTTASVSKPNYPTSHHHLSISLASPHLDIDLPDLNTKYPDPRENDYSKHHAPASLDSWRPPSSNLDLPHGSPVASSTIFLPHESTAPQSVQSLGTDIGTGTGTSRSVSPLIVGKIGKSPAADTRSNRSSLSGSSMHEMVMDELSYLSSVIQ